MQDLQVGTTKGVTSFGLGGIKHRIRTTFDIEKKLYGCIALQTSDRLVVTDSYNCSIKLVDIVLHKVLHQLKLNSLPWGVCCLPGNRVAVTLPFSDMILILECNDRLTIVKSIAVQGVCWDIDYNSTDLVVLYRRPKQIDIVDMDDGKLKQRFLEKGTDITSSLSVCADKKVTFITDFDDKQILRLDEDLQVQQIYHLPEVAKPTCLLAVGRNQLLVCCSDKLWQLDTVIGRWSLLLGEGFRGVDSMAYCHERHILYAGVLPDNVVKRYLFP